MTKDKPIQKVRFLGQPEQIYHIGRESFPHNVWRPVTPDQLQQIIENKKIRALFDFEPLINFSLLAEKKAVKKSKKKKKEDN